MQLTAVFLLACSLSLSARSVSQTVTFKGNNVSLEKVLLAVKKQTGYFIVSNYEEIKEAKPISIDAKNLEVGAFLSVALKNQPFEFVIKEKSISIKAKPTVDLSPRLDFEAPPVTGVIRDAEGNPIPGVNIVIKGTSKGTTSAADGSFSINADDGAILIISGVGYETQEVKLTGGMVAVSLKIAQSKLDEVQIIAYGTTSRRLSTGNISTVKAADIEKQPVNNPLLALQGRVPGLVIEQATGIPGSGVVVRIQGQNSIEKGNDPLYVIDEVPYMSQLLPTLNAVFGSSEGVRVNGRASGSGNPLSFINPADIESIDVLKDADATAIYGSRAANGAILITTKKGKAGPTRFNVNVQSGWGKVTSKLDVLNREQYLEMRNEAFRNDGLIPTSNPDDRGLNGKLYAIDLTIWDTTRSTDWQKEFIGGTARYTDAQASVSGGERNTQFLVGAGYHKETSVFPGDNYDQKGSLHLNINHVSANKKFRLQLSGSYLVDNNNAPGNDLTKYGMNLSPVAPALYNADGSLNWAADSSGNSTWVNPLAFLYTIENVKTHNLTSNMQVSYEVTTGLEVKSSFGYTNMQTYEYVAIPLENYVPEKRPSQLRTSHFGNNTFNSKIMEPQISYQRTIKKGRLELLLGSTIQQNMANTQQITGSGYSSDQLMENIMSAAEVRVAFSNATSYKYNAVFGRINYNWQNKYIVNVNARRDGSSRFGRETQFRSFGSIGGAWIFSSEPFMQKAAPFLSFGKLRGSYGTTGNDQIGDYQFLNQYSSNRIPFSYQGATGLLPEGLPNPHLAWEETRKAQFGLDLGFFEDKALLNINYFCNRSSNQLLPYNLPIITGFGDVIANFPATVQNSGWEISLNTKNFTSRNFSWTSNINLTVPKNKLVKFPDLTSSTYGGILIIDQPITIRRLYPLLGVNPTTGLYEVADSHGNPTSSPNFPTDQTLSINTSLPKFYGGFQNSFSYKGLQIDLLFQFVKQTSYFPVTGFSSRPGRFFGTSNLGNQPASVWQRWQKPGDNKPIQQFSTAYRGEALNAWRAGFLSDANIVDGSYIRLKNLSLSWQLPIVWVQKTHFQNCRLYIQGQNLLTITNYQGDPETRNPEGLPPLRVLTLGAQLTL